MVPVCAPASDQPWNTAGARPGGHCERPGLEGLRVPSAKALWGAGAA